MDRPLEHVLRTAGAELEDVALAIAAEFSAVDAAAAHARLDVLACGLGGIAELDPEARPEALVEELDRRQGFECTWRGGPESLLLDRVLEQRSGHPLSLVIVYAAIARRAGVRLHPVGGGRVVILADPSSTPAVAFDPIGVPRRVPRTIGWVCPHVFGTMILEALSGRLVERGEIDIAARALQLTFAFPLRGRQRARSMRGLASLRARLN